MHKLIVLRGNSGSGKTTVAKELQKVLGSNTMLISQDVIRRDMLNVKDGKDTLAIPLLMELLRYGRNNSEVVILEGILVADWYRLLFELAVELYGTNIYAYYYDISFEETIKRHQTRSTRCEFGEKTMKSWWVDKDYSEILNEVMITESQSKEEIVQEIYNDIQNK
ncbi:MAG: kinase [Eubacteriales bacterium]|nr:kinase [Eubacteriales bacterium]